MYTDLFWVVIDEKVLSVNVHQIDILFVYKNIPDSLTKIN